MEIKPKPTATPPKVLIRLDGIICMVTHDPRFARHAGRTVQLFDGRMVEEDTASSPRRPTDQVQHQNGG